MILDDNVSSNGFSINCTYYLDRGEVKEKLRVFRKHYPTESVHWDEPRFYDNPEVVFQGKSIVRRK